VDQASCALSVVARMTTLDFPREKIESLVDVCLKQAKRDMLLANRAAQILCCNGMFTDIWS
jgi:hypothetical protein